MPDLVTCPSCGCRVQVAQTQLGRRTRCIACATTFLAEAEPPSPPMAQRPAPQRRIPLCPGCDRPVGWEAEECPYCGHLFAPDEADRPLEFRRDGVRHRGELIDRLGGLCLLFGGLSIGLGPFGVVATWLFGIPAVGMANRDLAGMRTGLVDPTGRSLIEWGRTKAIVGLTLSTILGLFWFLLLANLLR